MGDCCAEEDYRVPGSIIVIRSCDQPADRELSERSHERLKGGYWPKTDKMIFDAIGFLLVAAFGFWMVYLVVSALRTGRIYHTDSTSTFSFRKQPVRFVLVAMVFLTLAAMAFYLVAGRWQSFWAVDRCLDAGGRWDYQLDRCADSAQ